MRNSLIKPRDKLLKRYVVTDDSNNLIFYRLGQVLPWRSRN